MLFQKTTKELDQAIELVHEAVGIVHACRANPHYRTTKQTARLVHELEQTLWKSTAVVCDAGRDFDDRLKRKEDMDGIGWHLQTLYPDSLMPKEVGS